MLYLFLVTVISSSNLNKFSNNTFNDLGNFEIPSKPFFSAFVKLKNCMIFPEILIYLMIEKNFYF